MKENDNQNLSESEASKVDSSQMNSKKLNSYDFTKNFAEYSLKTNDNENIIAKKTYEADEMKARSSKSHWKIVTLKDKVQDGEDFNSKLTHEALAKHAAEQEELFIARVIRNITGEA